MDDSGFIKVDHEFRTNIEDIYAAGDITKFALELFSEEEAHIEHWQTGQKQGRFFFLKHLSNTITEQTSCYNSLLLINIL